jgi:hypothetical protein
MNIESGLRFVDSLAFDQTKPLAYQLLLSLLASFGGGPNVNSRDAATKGGWPLPRESRVRKVSGGRAREHLARKSTWRESYFLAAFSGNGYSGGGVPWRAGMAGGYPT